MFNRVFGNKPGKTPASRITPASHPHRFVKMKDEEGRDVYIEREEWRRRVLPANLEDSWSDPDRLYEWIEKAVRDGFAAEVLDAADRLFDIDPNEERRYLVRAVAHKLNGALERAESLLLELIDRRGPTPLALFNLAQVQADKGDPRHEATLWRSLEGDPNDLNALGWLTALARERDPERGEDDALRRVAALPGSFRAQVWMGRNALAADEPERAKELFADAIAGGGSEDGESLATIIGDLGPDEGFAAHLIGLVAPVYTPRKHGLRAGVNLLRAYAQTGRFAEGRELLAEVKRLATPDWRAQIGALERMFAEGR